MPRGVRIIRREYGPYMNELHAENKTVNCQGNPGPYIDFGTEDDPMEGAPTPLEAWKLCLGCPALQRCRERAIAEKETCAVWGGLVFGEDGKPIVD